MSCISRRVWVLITSAKKKKKKKKKGRYMSEVTAWYREAGFYNEWILSSVVSTTEERNRSQGRLKLEKGD